MKTAEIFTRPSCPHCIKAKEILKRKEIEITEYIVGTNGITKEMIEDKIGNGLPVKTVPQIFIDGKYIGGCSDLIAFLGNI